MLTCYAKIYHVHIPVCHFFFVQLTRNNVINSVSTTLVNFSLKLNHENIVVPLES